MARNETKDQKTTIRREAARLFAKQGYHATGIEDISQAVGLGRGALYHHIGSKEQLLFEISSLGLDELTAACQDIVDADMPASEKLRAMSRVHMRNLIENKDAMTVYLREVDLMSKQYRTKLVTRRHGIEDLWAKVVEDGVAAGELRPIDPIAVKGMLGMHNYAYIWIRGDGRLSPEEIADEFCSMFLEGLLAA